MKRQIRLFLAAATITGAITTVDAATTTSSLTITSYNIHSAIPNERSNSEYVPGCENLANIVDVLTTCGAEIIGLQEVRNTWTLPVKGKIACPLNFPVVLANQMNMNFAYGSALDSESGYPENRGYIEWGQPDHWTNNDAKHGEYGNAVLTKFPLAGQPQIVALPKGNDEMAKQKGDEPRIALRVELKDELPGFGPIVVYNTHFQHNNGNTRRLQMEHLLRLGKADASTATVFLMGDFNHYPHEGEPDLLGMVKAAGFHDLAADYAAKTGTKPAATMQEAHRPERIDYIFCSKPVNVTNVTVLKSQVSDHLPVTVTVEPN